jgi:hypothetical protein
MIPSGRSLANPTGEATYVSREQEIQPCLSLGDSQSASRAKRNREDFYSVTTAIHPTRRHLRNPQLRVYRAPEQSHQSRAQMESTRTHWTAKIPALALLVFDTEFKTIRLEAPSQKSRPN